MKVLGIIPARYNSTRFPGKPLIDLKGKTMIQHVYEGAQKCTEIDTLIVATDDQRIVETVEAFGGKAVLTSIDHPSGTDRCGEVAVKYPNHNVVINIQGDEPLVNHKQLSQLIAVFKDNDVEIATLATKKVSQEDIDNPNRIKVVRDINQNALYFSRSAIPNVNHAKTPVLEQFEFLKHIGLYAFKTTTLLKLITLQPSMLEQIESLEQLRWMYYNFKIRVVETSIETPNIDTPEDVKKVLELI
ncbi:MAG: 3-deoxy-manno-octulosonate cytidylyltransferase [Lishizhenia sp.]